ncbi:MAG: hypothetical protein ABIP51_07860 [Bacteroidia bacterium]
MLLNFEPLQLKHFKLQISNPRFQNNYFYVRDASEIVIRIEKNDFENYLVDINSKKDFLPRVKNKSKNQMFEIFYDEFYESSNEIQKFN